MAMKSPLPVSLAGRDLLTIADLVPAEAEAILDLAEELKLDRTPAPSGPHARPHLRPALDAHAHLVRGRDRPARRRLRHADARRRCSSRAASRSSDTAHVLSRYLDALAIRILSHDELEQWAAEAEIPVINALTSVEHPCQALADALTIRQRLGGLEGVKVAWVGDGTNVLVSLAQHGEADRDGGRRRLPGGLRAAGRTPRSGSSATRARRPRAPMSSSPTSGSRSARRRRASSGCATSSPTGSTRRCSRSPHPSAVVLHCLPAHPGEEITPGALYGDHSAVWDEAENRLHVQKALLALLLG